MTRCGKCCGKSCSYEILVSENAPKVRGSLFLAAILHHDFPSRFSSGFFCALKRHKNCTAGKIMPSIALATEGNHAKKPGKIDRYVLHLHYPQHQPSKSTIYRQYQRFTQTVSQTQRRRSSPYHSFQAMETGSLYCL